MPQNELFELADHLRSLKERKAQLDAEAKIVGEEIGKTEAALAKMMTDEEVGNFSRNGQMYYLSTRVFASPVASRKPELFAWLREKGYGEMIQETVNSNTLSAFVKEQIDENGQFDPVLSELVNVFEKTTIGMRKAAK